MYTRHEHDTLTYETTPITQYLFSGETNRRK